MKKYKCCIVEERKKKKKKYSEELKSIHSNNWTSDLPQV